MSISSLPGFSRCVRPASFETNTWWGITTTESPPHFRPHAGCSCCCWPIEEANCKTSVTTCNDFAPIGRISDTLGHFYSMFHLLLGTFGINLLFIGGNFWPSLFVTWRFFAKYWVLFLSKHQVTLCKTRNKILVEHSKSWSLNPLAFLMSKPI